LPLARFADLLEADRRLLQDYFATAPPRPRHLELAPPPLTSTAAPTSVVAEMPAPEMEESLAGRSG
jgi:hypothetical protein